jgi:Golgi nucleoside diphosphatase
LSVLSTELADARFFLPEIYVVWGYQEKKLLNFQKKLLTGNFYAHFLAVIVCSVNNLMIYCDNFSRQI